MPRKAGLVLAFSSVVALLLVFSVPAYAQSSGASQMITQRIDETRLVTLAGNTRPEVHIARDMGAVSDSLQMSHMYLQMKMSPPQQADVAALMNRLHDPASPEYHKWLSVADIEERFGPAEADVKTVSAWLESHGFTVNVVYRANDVIDFSGPASAIREAFHTEIHNIELRGAHHIANMRDPQVPAAIAAAVHGVTSMNDFRPHSNLLPRKQFNTGNPNFPQALVPGDLATIYDINPVYKAGITGKGQTIVVVEDSNIFSAQDFTDFRNAFGLNARFPHGSVTQVHPQPSNNPLNGGTCDDPGLNGDDGEAEVDMEWASAAAPNAAIVVATCADTNTNFGGFIAIQNLITSRTPPPGIISISYGGSESEQGAAFNVYTNQLFQLAVLEGISIYVSSSDAGADTSEQFQPAAVRGLNVSSFATTAHAVAVGGTDFADTFLNQNSTYWNATNGPFFDSAKSYIPEIPWNDSCAGQIVSEFVGSPAPGSFCNTSFGENFLIVAAGSGGASSCFSGTPAIFGVANGTCKGNPKPTYQLLAAGIPHDGVRDIPDISLFASNGFWGHYYVFCYSDPNFGGAPCPLDHPELWAGAGGTSFGAPIMAGVQALLNEASGVRFDGNPNYAYYTLNFVQNLFGLGPSCDSNLGTKSSNLCIFHDVTLGDMDVNCLPLTDPKTGAVIGTFNCFIPTGLTNGVMSLSNTSYQPTYGTKRGYDFATGMGSVDVFNLVRSWPGSRLHQTR